MEDLAEEEVLEDLLAATTAETDLNFLVQFVTNAEKTARFPSVPQVVNQFIAVPVLKLKMVDLLIEVVEDHSETAEVVVTEAGLAATSEMMIELQ